MGPTNPIHIFVPDSQTLEALKNGTKKLWFWDSAGAGCYYRAEFLEVKGTKSAKVNLSWEKGKTVRLVSLRTEVVANY